MPLQLRPSEIYPISVQIPDSGDSTTYYCRAYIRNLNTDTLLATVNLTDKGEGRFLGSWEVVRDVSGQGYFVSILTKIFTDALLTTETRRYGRQEMIYLVQERYNPVFGNGGGGADISYKKVRQIIKEELDKMPKAPAPKEVDMIPVLKAVRATQEIIRLIKMPEQKEVKFDEVIGFLRETENNINNRIERKVGGIIIPEVDFNPLLNKLEEIKKADNSLIISLDEFKKVLRTIVEEIKTNTSKVEKKISDAPLMTVVQKGIEEMRRKRKFIT